MPKPNRSIFRPTFPGVAESKPTPEMLNPPKPKSRRPGTVMFDPGLSVSVTRRGESLDVRGKRSPSVEASSLLDKAGYLVVGEPFSKTNAAKLAAGKMTPRQFVTDPFKQHGKENAGMPPLPFGGRLFGASRAAEVAAPAGESVASRVVAASARARSEGFGRLAPKVERVKPGEVSATTGGELGAGVREALSGATGRAELAKMSKFGHERAIAEEEGVGLSAGQARKAQEPLYSAERGKRAAKAGSAFEAAGGGVAGHYAALSKLKGELPKLDFQGFKQFDQQALDALANHVEAHPFLREFEKRRATDAILKATGGKVPTKSEQALLEQVFGKDATQQIVGSVSYWAKAKNLGLEVLNVPRAFMASADMSAPFRQGLVVAVTRPSLFARNLPIMVKSFGSEKTFQALMENVYGRDTFPLMHKAGLALTDIGQVGKPVALEMREEQFMSNLAEHLNLREIPKIGKKLGKAGTGPGDVVRASDRAYVGFLDKTRADYFDFLVNTAAHQGLDLGDQNLLESIARYVNSATGRGDLGALQKHAVTLNTLMFSPRLLWSRLNFLNPAYYASLDPFVRKEALRAALGLVSAMGAVLYLAKLGGAKVNTDPRNADFAKIRIGNTRIDIAGGFQQPVRILAQLARRSTVNSSTGEVTKAEPGFSGWASFAGKQLTHFFEGKLAPVPSVVNDYRRGHDFSYQTPTVKREVAQHMIPLLAQDMADLYGQGGVLPAVGGYALGGIGFGLQTYGPQKPVGVRKPARHGGSIIGGTPGSGGSNSIFRSGGSSGSRSIFR